MPHVNMKHFPHLSEKQRADLTEAFTQAITKIMPCDESIVSIAFEPIEKSQWNDTVYIPEIMNRKELLYKFPNY